MNELNSIVISGFISLLTLIIINKKIKKFLVEQEKELQEYLDKISDIVLEAIKKTINKR